MAPLSVESWIWYGFATFVTLARFVARTVHFGTVKALQVDDWIMAATLGFYTTEVVVMNIVAHTSSNLFPPGWSTDHILTPHEISQRIYGSKLIIVVEQCQIATIWLIKACLLIMYYRITVHCFPLQNKCVIALSAYVVFGFIFMEIFYFGVWCRPFHDYWAVPTPHPQCSAATNHLITNAVFNLSSDILMLLISLPMFIRSNLPTRRKVALCGIFSIGIFVILSAILNKYYSFTQPYGSEWTYWYIRESSTAMIVANLPFTASLIRKVFGISVIGSSRADSTSRTTQRGRGIMRKFSAYKQDQVNGPASDQTPKNGDFATKTISRDDSDSAIISFSEMLALGPSYESEEEGPYRTKNRPSKSVRAWQSRSPDNPGPLPIMDKAILSPSRRSSDDPEIGMY